MQYGPIDNENESVLESARLSAFCGNLPVYKDAASPLLGEHRENRRSQIAHSLIHKQNGEEIEIVPAATSRHVGSVIRASLIANIILACGKLYAAINSGSLAVLSSLVDSILDLTSQGLFWFSDKRMHTPSSKYPAGRRRLEPIVVIISATLMGMAALEVIQKAVETLIIGYEGTLPNIKMNQFTIAVLLFAISTKTILWYLCFRIGLTSPTARAIAQDHRNDVLSNSAAVITSLTAKLHTNLWYIDSVGAILISLYIAISWLATGSEQVQRLVGLQADPVFIDKLRNFTNNHHPKMQADIIRAYHFGSNYLVEVEVILPEKMSVREAHDISLDLQRKIEEFDNVERAFVHVDYLARGYDEHKDPTLRRSTSSS
uniref:Cation Diffusion Facilitator (CDF) Family putative n=1 Tax=Albugo laibachii Nc14 TaxID=890382 RepID=F0WCI4_9STRA|nr:Cation Diffusion Facilitator (CDF) Family putative [Albugo laibachii Nc14]|eukprot:CCA18901.1 Cation Diffusion Facilitator (CDF) Family putative [Albugo laibachii Nc14]